MRIVIDLSNLAYICFYGMGGKNEESYPYDKDEFLEVCRYKIRAIEQATNAEEIIFAKDDIAIRKDLDEEYKANRHEIVFPIKDDLIDLLLTIGYKVCESPDKEADDIMATLLQAGRVDCIVSTDQDLLQAIEKGEQLFNPVTMTFWTKQKLFEKFSGLTEFKKVLFYKCFFGDTSDNIKKVGERLPKKLIIEKVNQFNSLNDILDSMIDQDYYSKIDKDRLYLNHALVKLNTRCKLRLFKR